MQDSRGDFGDSRRDHSNSDETRHRAWATALGYAVHKKLLTAFTVLLLAIIPWNLEWAHDPDPAFEADAAAGAVADEDEMPPSEEGLAEGRSAYISITVLFSAHPTSLRGP